MDGYASIKETVVRTLCEKLPEIRERFGVETIGVFGSVSRGEDTEESDVDILFSFREGAVSLDRFLDLAEYLESVFLKKVDLIPEDGIHPRIMQTIQNEVIWAHA